MLLNEGQLFNIHHGDAIEHMWSSMPPACVDLLATSPPFPQVFAYGDSEADIGNSEDLHGEAPLHFGFFFRAARRVLKPGRVMIIHCTQIHRSKRDGERGVFDFRGTLIRLAQRAGFIYEYDWLIRQDPQAQAIRGKKWELKFQGLETDRAQSRGAMGDYLLKFLVPGQNAVPIDSKGQIDRNSQLNGWVQFAEPCWNDIKHTDTLNIHEARTEADTRHICPFALEICRRLILLYTNPMEVVFDPFAGIASMGYTALGGKAPKSKKRIFDQRRFYGCELKDEYYPVAVKNCERALRDFKTQQKDLFAEATA